MDKLARVIAHLTVCVGVAESESQERVLVPVEIVRDALELLKEVKHGNADRLLERETR